MRSDAELIRAARRDPEAFGELYRRHAAAIHSWFCAQVDRDAAAELTAETFAQAAISLRRFRDRMGGSALPWLFGIAKNLLRRYFERDRIERSGRERLHMPSPHEPDLARIDELDRARRLRPTLASALATLPSGQRRALEMRVLEERAYGEIATSLACSEVAARIRVARALGTLARRLKGAA